MTLGQAYFDDIGIAFRKQKELADKAIRQVVKDEDFFRKPGPYSNSIALIVKHLAGNLQSRWTDFLTTDGEKPGRNRDGEFVLAEPDSRAQLLAAWESGWSTLFQTLSSLHTDDLLKKVTIRGEDHSVMQAIHRALTHSSYHVGQIVYLCRLLQEDGWEWITIPPKQPG